jgi:hypothetical protein
MTETGWRPRRRKCSRGERNIEWIEKFCLVPDGPGRGRRVMLSAAERAQVRAIYDAGAPPESVAAPLAAYLALLHTCGVEWQSDLPALEAVDSFTVWRCTSEALQAVLRRDGERIVCPQLGTGYPPAA